MATLVDTRVLSHAARSIAAVAEKDIPVRATGVRAPWGDEPGDKDSIALIVSAPGLTATARVPLEGGTLDDDIELGLDGIKKLGAAAEEIVKFVKAKHKEDKVEEDGAENDYLATIEFDDRDNRIYIYPTIPATSGTIIGYRILDDESKVDKSHVNTILNTKGRTKVVDEHGNELTSGALILLNPSVLDKLVKVSKVQSRASIQFYVNEHKAGQMRASIGNDDEVAGTALVSMVVFPEKWSEDKDTSDPDNVVDFGA